MHLRKISGLPASRAIISRHLRDAVMALAHRAGTAFAITVSAVTVALVVIPLLTLCAQLDRALGWATTALSIGEVLVLLLAVIAVAHFKTSACWRCMKLMPLDPQAEIRHFSLVLWVYHHGRSLLALAWVALGAVAVIAFVRPDRFWAAGVGFGVNICLATGVFAYAVHRRVLVWCSECGEPNESGHAADGADYLTGETDVFTEIDDLWADFLATDPRRAPRATDDPT